jgi:DNA-binding NarL/FixJ family response regulator
MPVKLRTVAQLLANGTHKYDIATALGVHPNTITNRCQAIADWIADQS